jgi:hypothetical protein
LLYSADSPGATDITGGAAGAATLGRATLLGGTGVSKLGA